MTRDIAIKYVAVVPAAGVGSRMGASASLPKQYSLLLDKTVMEHTLEKLLSEPRLERIIVVVGRDDSFWQTLPVFQNPRIDVTYGGDERCHSVLNGLEKLSTLCAASDWVLVHDVARPCILLTDIAKILTELAGDKVGGILAVPVSDTIKQVSGRNIVSTIDRQLLWQAQTPQMFRYDLLRTALINGLEKHCLITDEASAIELAGWQPKIVEGTASNLKITRADDLPLAEYYLQREQQQCE
ncbi:MAG: 2-C-methyl-D-erythritol 4-phosphate cytidylyltransferase [Oceanicoccus sp.]